MSDNKILGNLLFPQVKKFPEDYEEKYPLRELKKDACVTRFAPSPTGFIHIGGLFAALVSERVAHLSDGVFFLRIEDTDKKREVEGGIEEIIKAFSQFEIFFDEGVVSMNEAKGNYGPYKQSERKEIYQTFAKLLVEKGLAYPCFCSEEELALTRAKQEEHKLRPGYYGKWAKHRNTSIEEVHENLAQGKTFVLRIKSPGVSDVRIIHKDLIRGEVEMPENDQDTVILKSDGIPTYHFAHAIDDHFMRTTHVIRGDEWLPSIPLHLQLFEALGWETPAFAHISPIMKMDENSKRKLSKRKDPEAAVGFYHEQGFPNVSVIEYLLNLANSGFEDWRKDNPSISWNQFSVKLENMSTSGSLFDIVKLTDISKGIIAAMTAEEVFEKTSKWSKEYDEELYSLLSNNKEYGIKLLNIERSAEKPRKDFGKWSDVKDNIFYFYDSLFEVDTKENCINFAENTKKEEIIKILKAYTKVYNENDTKEEWLGRVRLLCEELDYAGNVKTFKKNPDDYKGHIGDVTGVIRIALTNRKNTPDMYEIMQVMGREMTINRITECIRTLVD